MPMDPAAQMESFSLAYIHAIAAVAAFGTARLDPDDDSIDLTIAQTGGQGLIRSPRLELQAKSTYQQVVRDDAIHYSLKIKNYNDLRTDNVLVPRILVVVLVPSSVQEWLTQSQEQLVLRRCGYWKSLRDEPQVDNETSVTVNISCSNVFSVEALREIMPRIANGGLP